MATIASPYQEVGTLLQRHGFIALSTYAKPGSTSSTQDEKASLDTLEAALEVGWTHWDISPFSSNLEKLCSVFIGRDRSTIFLADKTLPTSNPNTVIDDLYGSLKNLQTDYVDVYYLTQPREPIDLRPHFELLEKEKTKGTIKAIGVRNFSIQQMEQAKQVCEINIHQLCYNLYWRRAEEAILPFCTQNGIIVIAHSPLVLGILSGNPIKPTNGNSSGSFFFDDDLWPRVQETNQRLSNIASDYSCPLSHLAIQWLAQQSFVQATTLCAYSRRQVIESALALHRVIPPKIFKRITTMSDQLHDCYPLQQSDVLDWESNL